MSANNKDETAIRKLIDESVAALRAKNAKALVATQAENFTQFSLAPPLTTEPDEKSLDQWFATWSGPLNYEVRDLAIEAGENVAFSHSLNRMSGEQGGKKNELWFRQTLCFRKEGGEWRIVHEHESVPFYMDGSMKAAVDLKPEGAVQ